MDSLSCFSDKLERNENNELEQTSYYYQLPAELIQETFFYLSLHDLANASSVCHNFHHIAKDNYLWKTLFCNAFSKDFNSITKKDPWEVNFKLHHEKLFHDSNFFWNINIKHPLGQKIFFYSLRNLNPLDKVSEYNNFEIASLSSA